MSKFDNIWVEKYRPRTLSDIVLTADNRSSLESIAKDNEIPNLLFIGNAGIGKTSLAKILVHGVLKCQYLYINASDENGIDTIRTKVTGFSKVKSLDGNVKVIILDECDGLSGDAQRALRNVMEEYCEYTRFILTANYNHKVIPALQSRCQSFDLVPPLDDCVTRLSYILTQEGITVNDEITEKLTKFAKSYYPDLRKCVNELQKSCSSGSFQVSNKKASSKFAASLYSLVKQGLVLKVRKTVIESERIFNSDYGELLKNLFNVIAETKMSNDLKRDHLLIVSEYMYRMSFVVDPEINFYSCLIALSKST